MYTFNGLWQITYGNNLQLHAKRKDATCTIVSTNYNAISL